MQSLSEFTTMLLNSIEDSTKDAFNINRHQRRPLFFLHLPKTAGTSFISGMTSAYGNHRIERHYKGDPRPSKLVQNYLLKQDDLITFYQRLTRSRKRLYTGHRTLESDGYVFPLTDIITFVRNPVNRVISNYLHLVREYDHQLSIEEHLALDKFSNVQSRRMAPYPVELLGFVGITENYAACLDSLNTNFQLKVPHRRKNVNVSKRKPTFNDDVIETIRRCNEEDIALYDKVVKLSEQRLQVETEGHTWCYGNIDTLTDESLSGVAFMRNLTEAVTVQLLFEDDPVAESIANQNSDFYQRFNMPNHNRIKYHFDRPEGLPAFNTMQYKIRVKSSNQKLHYFPRQ